MPPPQNVKGPVIQGLIIAGYTAASLVGAFFGYRVGERIDGVLVGAIMALNAAVFSSLLFSIVAGWLQRVSVETPPTTDQTTGSEPDRR